MHQGAEAGHEQAGGAGAEIERTLQAGSEPLRADLVSDHVQQRTGGHRAGGLEKSRVLESGQHPAEQGADDARRGDERGARARGSRTAEIEEGQDHRGGERGVVSDDRDLQIQACPRLRQCRDQRQTFRDRVEDEGGEADLGRHAQSGEAAALQEAGTDRAREPFQQPGQRESSSHPQQRRQSLRGERLRKQVEGHHARGGREGEGARPFEDARTLPRDQGDCPAQHRGEAGERRGVHHRWHLSHRPRSSSTWPWTR